jgi:sigma-B regulation protein RsbU (phosphoserine phosphatase)
MIDLGTILGGAESSVPEARGKIHSLVRDLTKDAMIATRVAAVTSELFRAADRIEQTARIDVHLGLDRVEPELVLDLVGVGGKMDCSVAEAFFDSVQTVRGAGGSTVRMILVLPKLAPEAYRPERQRELRDAVVEKGRDALMRELTAKNRELQESFDNLRRTTTAKERMESELNIGRDIQMSMLPLKFPPFPHRNEFTVFATLEPAREVGGDFYDFFLVDEDRFCFCVGDVSGKGVPAALFMAVTKTLIKSRATNDFSPASILTHVNDEISENNDSAMFVTLWLGILDVTTGEMSYCNAGHNPPYLCSASGEVIRLAKRHGPVLGAVEGLVYGEDSETLQVGDYLFVYTDGVTEAMDPAGELYEEDRLVQVLEARDYDSVEELVAASTDDVWRFQSDAEQADDVTVLAMRFTGREGGAAGTHLLEIEADNRFAEIDRVNRSFDEFASAYGLPAKVRRSMKLVFDDLLNNVISYAYDDGEEHVIEIRVELSPDRLAVRITDDGHPFNPFGRTSPDTALALEEREIGGLGIHLVQNLMDEVSYTRRTDRNVVVLVKYLSHEPAENEPNEETT